jgi:hypothetical protein
MTNIPSAGSRVRILNGVLCGAVGIVDFPYYDIESSEERAYVILPVLFSVGGVSVSADVLRSLKDAAHVQPRVHDTVVMSFRIDELELAQ